jgi:hypothetical protein
MEGNFIVGSLGGQAFPGLEPNVANMAVTFM